MENSNRLAPQYSEFHGDRTNLVLHLATVPLFWAGTIAVAFAWRTPWLLLIGLAAMLVALAVQGRGHAREARRVIPFAGPGDFVRRIFVEQWVKFPRFVVTGELARAWRRDAVSIV